MKGWRIVCKNVLSVILCISLCIMYALPVSAAEVMPKENIIEKEEISATSSFSKVLPKLSSINGTASKVVTITSGFISNGAQITSIGLFVSVSSGSSPLILYIQAPDGTRYSFVITKSGIITIDNFNGYDPSGNWKIWIETQGTVTTVSGTIKVNYSY